MSPDLTLAVLAKSPVPGQVKTRLCPPLTDAQAARLYAAFVHDTVQKAQATLSGVDNPSGSPRLATSPCGGGGEPEGSLVVYYSGDPVPLQHILADLPPVSWCSQGDGDLGARLARVPAPCVILGTDSPHLPAERIQEARDGLWTHDVVLGPADDGGYYLIALRAPQPALFDGIAWSTSDVLTQTLDQAARQSLTVHLLPPCYDLDTAADLRHLSADLVADPRIACPATRIALEELAAAKLF